MALVEQPVMLSGLRFDASALAPVPRLQARVEHVYRLAAYLTASDGGDLVVLAVDAAGGQPNGINVPDGLDLRAICPIRARVWVDLSGATAWSSRLPAQSPRIAALALRRAREAAAIRATKDGFGPLLTSEVYGDSFARAAQRRIRALQDALEVGTPSSAGQAAAELVGLGVGLTPSGDDLLVGLLAGLEVVADPLRGAIADAVAAHAGERTPVISARALLHAVGGRYAQRLHEVLVAIETGDGPAIERSVKAAMRYGATSGADTLVGLFIGLQRGIGQGEERAVTAA
jgi:hypothetical protein